MTNRIILSYYKTNIKVKKQFRNTASLYLNNELTISSIYIFNQLFEKNRQLELLFGNQDF